MERNVKSYFDAETGVFVKEYIGNVELEDIFNSWQQLIDNNRIPANVSRFLIDYKKASILFSSKKAPGIANFYKDNDPTFANSKIAMLMVSPDQVVFPLLVALHDISFEVKTFYTREAAMAWLST